MDSKPSALYRPGSSAGDKAAVADTDRRTSKGMVDLPEIEDYYAWANQQACHLRAGRFELLDLPNVIDEIEALGRSEISTFRSNLTITLTHMLKWDHQRRKRSRSWANAIGEHRDLIEENLLDSPSLSHKQGEIVAAAYRLARRKACRKTRLPVETFPEICPYPWTQIMEMPYEPNET